MAKYHPGILNRIHCRCLAHNYPHHPGVHTLSMPEMIRGPAWCPYCLRYLGSPTPGRALVKKCPAGCAYSIGYLALISHPQLPVALTMALCQSLNRIRPGRMPTNYPQLIQPLSGGTTHAVPEPQQVWAELDSPVVAIGVQTERYLSYLFRHLCCMMWGAGQYTKQYVWHMHTCLGH